MPGDWWLSGTFPFSALICLSSLVCDYCSIGSFHYPCYPVVSDLGPQECLVWTASKQLPGRDIGQKPWSRYHCHSRLSLSGGFPGPCTHSKGVARLLDIHMHTQQGVSEAPGPTFIALTLSDEKGTDLVHRSQQLPLSILSADGSEEPSEKQQEWVSLSVGDTP